MKKLQNILYFYKNTISALEQEVLCQYFSSHQIILYNL